MKQKQRFISWRIDYPNTQRLAFDYYPKAAPAGTGNGDRRLKEIRNLGAGAGGAGSVISQFDYTYDAAGRITTWKQSDSGSADPRQYTFGYEDADRSRLRS